MKKSHKIAKILEGIGSIISLFPQEHKRKINLPSTPPYLSLQNDWEKIGIDMWHAFEIIKSQQPELTNFRTENDRFQRCPKQHP